MDDDGAHSPGTPSRSLRALLTAYLLLCSAVALDRLTLAVGLFEDPLLIPTEPEVDAGAVAEVGLDLLLIVLGIGLTWKAVERKGARLLLVVIGLWAFPWEVLSEWSLAGRDLDVLGKAGGVCFQFAALFRFTQTFPRELDRGDVFAAFASERGSQAKRWLDQIERWSPIDIAARTLSGLITPILPQRYRRVAEQEVTYPELVSWLLPGWVPWTGAGVGALLLSLGGGSPFSPVGLVGALVGGYVAVGIPIFGWINYEVGTEAERYRMLWILQGILAWTLLSVVCGQVLFATELALLPSWVEQAAIWGSRGALGLLFLSLIAAVFYRGAIDPRLAIEKTTLYGVLGMGLLFLFGVVENLVTDLLTTRFDLPARTGAWVAGGILAVALRPLHDRLRGGVEGFLEGRLPVRTPPATERTITTVLSSALVGTMAANPEGDDDTLTPAQLVHKAARKAANHHRGRTVETKGGRVLMEFEGPAPALSASRTLEESLTSAAEALGLEVPKLRTAVHVGEVARSEKGDLFGPAVETATRLQETASSGTVVLSREAVPEDLPDGVALEVLDACESSDGDRRLERLRVSFERAG